MKQMAASQRTKRADLPTNVACMGSALLVGLIAVQRNLGLGLSCLQRNKSLAQMNKSTDVGQATKGCSPLPVTQSGRAELRR